MRRLSAFLLLGLLGAAPAFGQGSRPAPGPAPEAPANPYRDLFTRWDGVNRDALDSEVNATQPAPGPELERGAIPAGSPLIQRSQAEAVALGERAGAAVRAGDCAEGERIAREAGDFALVRAVRAHCQRPR